MRKFNKISLLALFPLVLGIISSCGEPGSSDENKNYPTYDEDSIAIHYVRPDEKYDDWALWLWSEGKDGAEYAFNGSDSFGAVGAYTLSELGVTDTESGRIGFIVKSKGSWNQKDISDDRFIDISKFEKDEDNMYHVYLKQADAGIYSDASFTVVPEISLVEFTSYEEITGQTNVNFTRIVLKENGTPIVTQEYDGDTNAFRMKLPDGKQASFDNSYVIEITFVDEQVLEAQVSVSSLYKTPEFSTAYNYDGELGAIYTPSSTIFKVWSPVSSDIKVRIYNNGTPDNVDSAKGDDAYEEHALVKGDKGVFSAQINGDLQGKYYTYVVTNNTYKNKEVVDPYAKSAGVNGLRGMIVDFNKTNPEGWDNVTVHPYDRKELTVYETHVVDITSSSTWGGSRNYQMTFLGAAEKGTTYEKNGTTVTTGFDHIKELGVNAVQFLPIFDHANNEINKEFNWGYNPLNYNCLEGSYSTNPYDGYTRIKEFKELVKAYNEAGINIIMDVVYNHTNGLTGSNFDVLMPGYYYRYDARGKASNGSGCGNETASEMYMYRKFMIDSATFWAEEYKLGGFRFDLMGLHDIRTMDQLTDACKMINKDICIYGEPWTGGTTTLNASSQATQANGNRFQGYGQFNDQERDALIKGGMSANTDKGWVTNTTSPTNANDLGKIEMGIKGMIGSGNPITDANKTTNYVTCHDNYTLYDRIKAAGISRDDQVKKMAMLANSVVFTGGGTTFMLSGEEFLRTKGGNSNSYNASYEVNELNYALKLENADMFENYKKLIAFKQDTTGLHFDNGKDAIQGYKITKDGNVIQYTVNDETTGREYKVIHVNGYDDLNLPTVDLSGYTLYLDTLNRTDLELNATTQLHGYETIIAYR